MKRVVVLFTIILLRSSSFAQCPDDQHPHVIDLGLPSGKGWACCNVCATSPEDFGGYFAYGEYWEKVSYTNENYLYYENLGYGYYIWNSIGTRTDISGSAGYDVAYKIMGEDWRIPTKAECEELVDSCTWEWTSMYGNAGYKVIGPSGNYIFLPAAGFKSSNSRKKSGERGIYRSSMWTIINGEASTSYCIDFTQEGVIVNNLGYRANGLTVRPISSTSMKCYVNSSFMEEQKGKEARGFTADGKSEIAVTYKGGMAVLDENVDLKFYLDDQEVDESIAGKVKEIQYLRDSISIILTAPGDFLVSQGAEYKVKMEVTPYCGGKPLSKVSYKYRVLRPGVLFIHGLGDKGSLFYDMIGSLVNKGLYLKSTDEQGGAEGLASSPQLYSVDYSNSNTSSFMDNTKVNVVVKGGCETLCKNLFENDSIVSAKYDMVGHSMGGILARLYVQETDNGKESTNKIITLNTPHYGSPLGNVYQAIRIFEMLQNPLSACFKNFSTINNILTHTLFQTDNSLDAIKDLAMGSKAINDLNGLNSSKLIGTPVHSVCSYFVEEKSDNDICQPSYGAEIRMGLLDRLIRKTPHNGVSLLSDVVGDGVVPLFSQQGGLSGNNTSVFLGKFNEAMHMYTPHWNTYISETSNLLQDYKDGMSFSLNGFPPNNGQNVRRNVTAENDYLDKFEEPQDQSFISATISFVSATDHTHVCKVMHSDDMLTYEVFAVPTDETIIFGIDEEEMKFDLTRVESEELKFYIVGRTNYNALLLDSVVVNMSSDPTRIQSIHQKNENIRVSYSTMGTITVYLPYNLTNLAWQLYSMDGCFLCNGVSDKERIILNKRKSGVYILKVSNNGIMYSYKLLLRK